MPILINIGDHAGTFEHQAKIDELAEVMALIPALITTLEMPIMDNAGRPITYHLSYNGRRLQEHETLTLARVNPGDTVIVVPELTAGSRSALNHTLSHVFCCISVYNVAPHWLGITRAGYQHVNGIDTL